MDLTKHPTHPRDMPAFLAALADAWDIENAENADWASTLPGAHATEARGRAKQGHRYAAQLRAAIKQLEGQ